MQRQPSLLLVEERLDPVRDTLGAAGHLSLTLPGAVTEALLTRVPAVFHGGINDVLLTGLALAVADWCRRKPHRVAGQLSCRQPSGAGAPATRCCSIWRGMAARRIWAAKKDWAASVVDWATST